MNKNQTSLYSLWKYALILPVVAMFLFFSSPLQTKAEPVYKTDSVQQDTVNQIKPVSKEPIQIIDYAEIMPQFPGGDKALIKWLKDNIQYPAESAEKGIQGRVALRFLVTPDGSIEDVKVIKSLDSLCNNEAIRVVNIMPRWVPAKQNGKPVPVYYTLPITFRLQKSDASNKTNSVQHLPVLDRNKHFSEDSTQIIKADTDVIIMPQFPGGEIALLKYLAKNTSYPLQEARQGIQGRVLVGLVITPDGSVKDVKVLESVNPNLDNEALRVVRKIPKWIPATKNGTPVSVYYRLPVIFRLGSR